MAYFIPNLHIAFSVKRIWVSWFKRKKDSTLQQATNLRAIAGRTQNMNSFSIPETLFEQDSGQRAGHCWGGHMVDLGELVL